MQQIPIEEKTCGDLTSHLRKDKQGYKKVHGKYGLGLVSEMRPESVF